MSAKTEEILESLKSLSLLEASELVKQIEETFGVSAAASAGVVMAAPGAGGGDGDAAAAEEQSEFDVVLESFDASAKIKVLKVVRNATGLGLGDASKLSKITSNSLCSSAAEASPSPPPAPGAAMTTPAEAAADTPKVSSICFTSSDASRSERDFSDSRISSVFADIFLIDK